jgi:peptide/nickel transport system permease protein
MTGSPPPESRSAESPLATARVIESTWRTMAARRARWRTPLAFVGVLILVAVAAPMLAPYGPGPPPDYDLMKYLPPSGAHPFGTDSNGRDVLSRVLYGSRISLSLAFAAVSLALVLGTCYGAIAGLCGGAIDRWLMRLLDVALSIPRLLLLLAVTAFWDNLSVMALILLLGTTGWFDVARMVRGEVQSLAQRDFMLAARATGVGGPRLLRRHLLPHLVPILIVSATLNVASTIALESGLSYLSLGVQPPTPSWGNIMADGSGLMATQWWLTLFPGTATVIAVLACHALGDALRDVFAMDQVPA